MKKKVTNLAFILFCLTAGCTVKEKLMVQPHFPVFTTLELKSTSFPTLKGRIITVAGSITDCDETKKSVVLDDFVECLLMEGLGDVTSYGSNIGGATAIRGVIQRSKEGKYPYRLHPSGRCLGEAEEAKQKLLAESHMRPALRFNSFRGGLVEFKPLWNLQENTPER